MYFLRSAWIQIQRPETHTSPIERTICNIIQVYHSSSAKRFKYAPVNELVEEVTSLFWKHLRSPSRGDSACHGSAAL